MNARPQESYSEERYRSLIDKVQAAIILHDGQGRLLSSNPMAQELLGLSADQLLGKALIDPAWHFLRADGSVMPVAEYPVSRVLASQAPLRGYVTGISHPDRDGITWALVNAEPEYDESGSMTQVIVSFVDITDQQRAAMARSQLAAIVDSSSDAIIGKTPNGIITSWNKGAERMYGYTADEIVGKHISLLAPESLRGEIDDLMARVCKEEAVAPHESIRIRKDGRRIHVTLSVSAIRDASGRIVGISTIAHDISERQEAERRLLESESRLRLTLEASRIGIWDWDVKNDRWFASSTYYTMLGYAPKEGVADRGEWLERVHPDDRAQVSDKVQEVRSRGRDEYSYEARMLHSDGKYRWQQVMGFATERDQEGTVARMLGIRMDIDERKLAEERLRLSERGLAEAQRIARLGNWELDLVSNVLVWSDEIYRIFEIDPEKFGASYEAFLNAIHPEDREMVNKAYADSVRDKIPYDIAHRLRMPDGRIKYVNERCETYYGDDGKPLRSVGTVHDITERKRDEEALQRLNRELRAISNCSQAMMRSLNEQSLLDAICHIVCDEAGYRMAWVGYPENDAGKTIRPVAWAGVEDGYLERAQITWADNERGRGPSGSAIRGGMSVGIQDFDIDPQASPWRDAALQRGYRSSISLPLKDERANTFGILNIYSAVPNAFTPEEIRLLEELAGDMAFGIIALRTRIERQHAEEELRRYKDQLEETVQLRTAELVLARDAAEAANKAKSVFLANMSHELRTPLNAILGFSSMMKREPQLTDVQRENIDIINRSGAHLLSLINDVLEIAKIEAGRLQLEIEPFDLGAMVREVAEMMQLRAREKGLQLLLEMSSHVPRYIKGDEARLRQILTNLLGNAVKFTEQGGVTIRVGVHKNDRLLLLVEVEDSGPGMSEEDQKRIFRPFVQLADSGEQVGTGLGLTITKQFVELMSGTIAVESTVGKGSLFRFELPVELADTEELPKTAVAAHGEIIGLAPGQPAYRVLIVEDQHENQLLLNWLMSDIGIEARLAENGEQCVKVFEEWHPDLIWMDRRMPVMDGEEATRRVRRLPGGDKVKIVAVTASAFREEQQEMLDAGMDDFVRKPYRPDEIYDCLARQLNVKYRYGVESVAESAPSPLTATMLMKLPHPVRQELKAAIMSLDDKRITAILDKVGVVDAELARTLSSLTAYFDYPSILKAIDETNGQPEAQ